MEKQMSDVTIETLAYLAGMSSAGIVSLESLAEQAGEPCHQYRAVMAEQPMIKPLNF